jgi:DNA-binding transcriptional MerR regulator
VEAVRVADKWQELYFDLKGKNRQMERLKEQYRLDEATYEELLELSAEELSELAKRLNRTEKKVQRRNSWLYALGGIVAAETITLAVLIGLK